MNPDALRLILFTTASNIKQQHHSSLQLRPLQHYDVSSQKLQPIRHPTTRCPPCKAFSPQLINFYNTNKGDLEVLFVSSDRDEKSFSEYFAKMPFLAMMPGYSSKENSERQAKLASMFQIQVCLCTIVCIDVYATIGSFMYGNWELFSHIMVVYLVCFIILLHRESQV